ncbi:hypothetical protein N7499_009789 [Penicillium canescens]|uniref:Uncharacterized protein n=1 Tax=Penicillium canescens TaxID=5083 RepID=A0AAD6NFD6_PENCN|nr:uncharacterized protein N7446_008195 [Penicillium canescens]KAJ6019056.1 hypothetical protein N7522_001123 [Penicillium canescens]KAJ6033514.1 hypothetical protein N7444_011285 [Penicillium canescens]KAJ6057295.1 hypothetical protein N7460_000569 [Penicillium canescens]KAJ6058612.1 hypothetical protein N7446_008195 [Penicillium canescens]KAJ6071775.1 hypothetical protein N7499_009789 [Penicillium canescens]
MPSTPWTKPDTSTRPIAVVGAGMTGRRICTMWVAAGFSLEMKIEILAQIHNVTPPVYVITSNSSSLESSQMIIKTEKNYRICNGQYYMPPEQVNYEVMSCGHTDLDIFPFWMEKASIAGFQPVHAQVDSTGFGFDRIWASIKRECLLAWFKAAKSPCQMMDTVGLDTVYNIEVIYVQQREVDPTARNWLKKNYVDKGNLGAKGGKGLLGYLCNKSVLGEAFDRLILLGKP